MISVGQHLERYEVEGLLGSGGAAMVYRVRHTVLGTSHALKVLHSSSASIRERALQEARIQASLRHPNVLSVTDVIDVNGAPGLVMELITGPDMEGWLGDEKIALDQALDVFRQVVEGVAAAHAIGCVHRDLKPANILIETRRGRPFPRVSDFGLATRVLGSKDAPRLTMQGALLGTPAYMAPEQARDASSAGEPADIFALGCILYRMVCGAAPFPGDDIYKVLLAASDRGYIPPREHRPDLPARVVDTIEGALAPQPEERLRSCEALLTALFDQAGTGYQPTIDARAAGLDLDLSPKRKKGLSARVLVVTGAVALLGMLGLGVAIFGVGRLSGERAAESEAAQSAAVEPTPEAETVAAAQPPEHVDPVLSPTTSKPAQPNKKPRPLVSGPAGAQGTPPISPAAQTRMGHVSATGDALQVRLSGGGHSYELGDVPPGSYQIKAAFDGGGFVHAGDLVIAAGQNIVITCDGVFQQCRH